MSSVTFFTAAGQNAFTAAERVSDYEYAFPLGENEPTAVEATARYWQNRANYSRPAPSSNISLPSPQNISNSVTAYFIDDLDFKDLGGGVTEFARKWSTLPASWSEDSQYAFAYPAFTYNSNLGNAYAVSAIAANALAFPTTFTLTTANTGGTIANLDPVFVDLTYVSANTNTHVSMVTTASNVANTSLTITGLVYTGFAYTSVSGSVRKGQAYRENPETIVADARILHDYALTDGTVANIQAVLPTVQPFTPVLANGAATDTLSGTTIPTNATWSSMVDAGTEIVAEASKRSLYAGLIHERQTIYVKAR